MIYRKSARVLSRIRRHLLVVKAVALETPVSHSLPGERCSHAEITVSVERPYTDYPWVGTDYINDKT